MKENRSLTFETTTWSKIDELRGDVPRSRFCEKVLVALIEKESD